MKSGANPKKGDHTEANDEAQGNRKRRNSPAEDVVTTIISASTDRSDDDTSAKVKHHKIESSEVKVNPSKEEVGIQSALPVGESHFTTQPVKVSLVNIAQPVPIAQPVTHNPQKEEMSDTVTWYENVCPLTEDDMDVMKSLVEVPYQGQTKTNDALNASVIVSRWCQHQTLQYVKLYKHQDKYYFYDGGSSANPTQKRTSIKSVSQAFSYVIIDTTVNGQRRLELRIGMAHHFLALDEEKVRAIFKKFKIDAESLAELEKAKAANTDPQIKYPEKITLASLVNTMGCKTAIISELQSKENVCKVVAAGEISLLDQNRKIMLTPQSGTFYNASLNYKSRANIEALFSRLRAHDFFPLFQCKDVVICNTLTEGDKFKKSDRVPLSFTHYQSFKDARSQEKNESGLVEYRNHINRLKSIASSSAGNAGAVKMDVLGSVGCQDLIDLASVSSEEICLGLRDVHSETSDEASANPKKAAAVTSVIVDAAPNTQPPMLPTVSHQGEGQAVVATKSVALSHASLFQPVTTTITTDAAVVTLEPIAPKGLSPDAKKKAQDDDDGNSHKKKKVDTKTSETVNERPKL